MSCTRQLGGMRLHQELISVFLQRPCPVCGGQEGAHGAGVCGPCRLQLGSSFSQVPLPPGVDQAWALGSYGGPLGQLVQQAKFDLDLALADAIGRWMGAAAVGLPPVDLVVPVSAPWWRTLRRGQDLPPRLAGPIGTCLGVPVRQMLRQRACTPQHSKGRDARLALPEDRFVVRCAVPPRILLVDDVQTTGSTLSSCAALLRASGATWVGTCVAVVRVWQGVKIS